MNLSRFERGVPALGKFYAKPDNAEDRCYPKSPKDSPRWCDRCQDWGDHHTDRHLEGADSAQPDGSPEPPAPLHHPTREDHR